MAVRKLLTEGAFDPEAIAILVAAFERVCRTLQLEAADPLRDAVASKVLDLARSGERNPDELYERTLNEVVPDK